MAEAGFRADDGRLAATSNEEPQMATDCTVDSFKQIGPKANITKTKPMIGAEMLKVSQESTPTCKQWISSKGPTHSPRKQWKMMCPHCQHSFQEQSMQQHTLQMHGAHPDSTRPLTIDSSLGQAPD